jgi:hypothetical protein
LGWTPAPQNTLTWKGQLSIPEGNVAIRIRRIKENFGSWQPKYAEQGLPTFPLNNDKIPAVRNYGKIGLTASRMFASQPRFAEATRIGSVCGKRTKLTGLDVDTTDERILRDCLDRHGNTAIIVKTASGKFHAWYKWNGERRRIRPWGPQLPVDLIGGGVLVLPPTSIGKIRIYPETIGGLQRTKADSKH